MDFTKVKENLEKRAFKVSVFGTAAEAVAYLDKEIDGTEVGMGGSMTIKEMGLYDALCSHNTVYWHQVAEPADRPEIQKKAAFCDVYISSVNGLAETGEMINIDGNGNRVAATIFGHKKVYLIIGRNKLAEDYDKALYRARNIAGPKNAMRFNTKTPCVANGGDKCYDCKSPARICNAFVTLAFKPWSGDYEVLLIDEDLGF